MEFVNMSGTDKSYFDNGVTIGNPTFCYCVLLPRSNKCTYLMKNMYTNKCVKLQLLIILLIKLCSFFFFLPSYSMQDSKKISIAMGITININLFACVGPCLFKHIKISLTI